MRLRAPSARWLPAAFAVAYAVTLFAGLGRTIRAIYENSDVASGPVIGDLAAHAPSGSHIVLGNVPWYSALWFADLTRWLPAHRQIWEIGPWLAFLAAVGLLGWSTAKAAGRFAAALVALVLACAGPGLLPIVFSWTLHGATVVHVCVLDAFLVLLITHGGKVGSRAAHIAFCVVVGAFTAAGAGSDKLLFVAGIVPFLLAGLYASRAAPGNARRALALSVAGTTVIAVAGSFIVVKAMAAEQIRGAAFPIDFVQWDQLGANVRNLFQSIFALFGADFAGASIDARSLLDFLCAVVLVAALVAVLRVGRSWFVAIQQRPVVTDAGLRVAHISFWLLAALLSTVVYLFSDIAAPGTGRYLVSAVFGVAVVAAVRAAEGDRRMRLVATIAACVIVTGSTVGLAAHDLRPDAKRDAFTQFLGTLAAGDGLQVGYASYWDAAALTWALHERVQVYPIEECATPKGYCWFPFHRIDTWYTPRAGIRSFLVIDKRYGPNPPGLRLGGPEEVLTNGPYTVYVYNYDIASDLSAS